MDKICINKCCMFFVNRTSGSLLPAYAADLAAPAVLNDPVWVMFCDELRSAPVQSDGERRMSGFVQGRVSLYRGAFPATM